MKCAADILKPPDLEVLQARGMTADTILSQIDRLNQANRALRLVAPARVGRGILRLVADERTRLRQLFHRNSQEKSCRICKFVPASGAATRMFSALAAWRPDLPSGSAPEVDRFFERLKDFPFYPDLIEARLNLGSRQAVIAHLLKTRRFAERPKALLPFHLFQGQVRLPLHEHLDELATLAGGRPSDAFMHLTVSEEHRAAFVRAMEQISTPFPCQYSSQEKKTDTVALGPDGTPLRDSSGALIFRPGGHGALIHNLGRIDADLIFIKNVDNVPHPQFSTPGMAERESMAGLLLEIDAFRHRLIQALHREKVLSKALLAEIGTASKKWPGLFPDSFLTPRPDDRDRLLSHLDRPLRICGMVPNQGEPGGGPFWVENQDGQKSLQIVEGAQIDQDNPEQAALFAESTHFHPVDMVCRIQDFSGRPYDLKRFIDPSADFVTTKPHGPLTIKVLEHPGLWNGAMAGWLTLFVEMSPQSFCPVKTVNDLLRLAHQPCEAG